ncbi:MAG: SpoIIE family protein phosphatase [Desulfobacterales bacterium]|jgi:sigma-B regulation protein RsbU (phosphoserine phosphatase)
MTHEDIDCKVSGILSSEEVVAAFQAQSVLFEKFISMARSPDEPEVVKAMLQETIGISTELTGAELGSLILIDSDGRVVDSILSRGEISPENSSMLIKSVFKEGLAGWVMRHRKIGLVHDTEKDDRWLIFPDQPYMARSALALPIISNEMLLGVLTLLHPRPNHFTKKIVELINITTNQVALILENVYFFNNLNDSLQSLGKANKQIEAYSQALDRELEKCRQIQKDFLPKQLLQLDNWYMEEFFFPASRVSGDFYDAFLLPGGYAGFVIGDVCDKGVGSALFMALIRSLIRIFAGQAQLSRSLIDTKAQTVGGTLDAASVRKYNQVEAIRAIALTNDYIAQEHGEMCMFATLFFGVLDPKNGRLIYVSGGHETVFVIDQNGIREKLLSTGPAVGLHPQAQFKYKQLQLKPGDILFSYTDGVIDARSPDEKRFTRKRLSTLLSQPVSSAFELMQRVGTQLFSHIGRAQQEDDITMLTLQRKIQ